MTLNLAGVVLAGGAARRLGGCDKPMLPVQGRSMLERTLEALDGADPIVVVGPRRSVHLPVRWAREDPPGSGPLAAIAAGLAQVPTSVELVAILASDHPYLTVNTLRRLRSSVADASGAVLVDHLGNRQWLLGVWWSAVLRREMPERVRDRPVRALFDELAPVSVRATGTESSDVDTPEDLAWVESED